MASKSTTRQRKDSPVATETVIYEGEPSFLADAARSYLEVVKALQAHNEKHKPSDAEWTTPKLVAKAREVGDDDPEVSKLLKTKQDAQDALTAVNSQIAKFMAKKLGVSFQEEAPEPDKAEVEALKTLRAKAVETAKAIDTMVSIAVSEKESASTVKAWLEANPLPGVGRNQSWSATAEASATPKHRVDVTAEKDGVVLYEKVRGFTSAAQKAQPFYKTVEKDKRITAEVFRSVWERGETTFTDNGITYTMEKRS